METPSEPTSAASRFSRINSRKRRRLRDRQTQEALRLAEQALLSHPYWCGFNKDAPGDPIFNEALRAVKEARRG